MTASAEMKKTDIPDGYKMNAKGNLVPLGNIKPLDAIRDEEVLMMVQKARVMQQHMLKFKNDMFDALESFLDLSFEEYGVKRGGKKGNIQLLSFDGTRKVQLAVSERISFDERMQVAKELIHECITDWSGSSSDRIKTLVNQAFQADKQGNISTAKVLSLRRLDMDDKRWDKAMKAISDSVTVTDSKNYIRFYERDASDAKWNAIPLDIAAL